MKGTPRGWLMTLLLCSWCWPLSLMAASEALPPPMRTHFDQAVDLLNRYRGDPDLLDAARVELEVVLQSHPRHAPAYRELARYRIMQGYLGPARFRPGSLEAADVLIAQAIEIDPGFAEAYVLRGHLFKLMHRHQDAVAALQQAEQLGTGDPWLHNNWADLLIEEGRYDDAARHYRAVIDDPASNRKAKAAALEGLTRHSDHTIQPLHADTLYRQLLDLEANSAWSHGRYAQFLLCTLDAPEQSVAQARAALRLMDHAVGRAWLAAGLYRLWARFVLADDPEQGQRYFIEAQLLQPDVEAVASQEPVCAPLASVSKALARLRGDREAALPRRWSAPRNG